MSSYKGMSKMHIILKRERERTCEAVKDKVVKRKKERASERERKKTVSGIECNKFFSDTRLIQSI